MAATNTPPATQPLSARKSRLVIWGGLFLVLLGIAVWNYVTFAGGPWSADPDSPDCIKAKATVTEVHATGGSARKSKESYFVSYEYTVGDETYEEKSEVTYGIYGRTRLGDPIEVCYMRDHPGRSTVVGNDVAGRSMVILLLVDVGVVAVLFLLLRAWIKGRRKQSAA